MTRRDDAPPALSVVIACYRAESVVGRCLDSLQRQETRHPFEVIVVNSSPDTTPEIVRDGLRLTRQTASVLGLPVSLLVVEERLAGAFPRDFAPCPILPIRRLVYPSFERPLAPRIAEVRPTRAGTIPTALTVSGPIRSTVMLPAQPGKGA